MSHKNYKKKELLILIDHLTEELDNLHTELKDKDNKINALLSELEVINKPITKLDKQLIKKNDYLLRKIKCTTDENQKDFYQNYYNKINNLI